MASPAPASSSSSSSFGVVFDLDGVLLRGETPVPGAREVLLELQRENVPFAVMTNGGGYREAKKAQHISKVLGVEIPEERVILCHTPMRQLAAKHRDDLVLVVGKNCDESRAVMASYGFKNVVTPEQMHNHFPELFPDMKIAGDAVPHHGRFENETFAAVFVLIDPLLWGRDMQIMIDVLTSQDGQFGKDAGKQHVPLYSACADFQFVGEFHLPRYGSGAFRAVLEALYQRTTGHELESTMFGKPEKTSFSYAEALLDAQHANVDRIYMVGDNPVTDIKGANDAGGRWRSILTLTGMHKGPGNHSEHIAHQVVDDVAAALAFIKADFKTLDRSSSML